MKTTSPLRFLLALIAVSFSLALLKAGTPIQPSEAEKVEKCEVCHNGTNPHTIIIGCNKVNRYLQNHPGDYEGPCVGVSPEKPPKPTPTPKP